MAVLRSDPPIQYTFILNSILNENRIIHFTNIPEGSDYERFVCATELTTAGWLCHRTVFDR